MIDPREHHEINVETNEAIEIVDGARTFVITNQEDLDFAGEALRDIKAKVKSLEAKKKTITDPINAALKAARDLFKPAEAALAEAEGIFRDGITAWITATEERNRAAMAAVASAHARGDAEAATEALASVASLDAVDGVSSRQTWDFQVVAPASLPREFLVPDEKKIREYMREAVKAGLRPELQGVSFFQKIGVAVKAGKG